MTTSPLRDQILHRIESESVSPIPRWHFTVKRAAYWLMFGLALLVGAQAVSLLIFHLSDGPFGLLREVTFFRPGLWLRSIPLIWLGAVVVSTLLGVWGLHTTPRGYRFPWWQLTLINLTLSGLLGVTLWGMGVAQWADDRLEATSSQYQSVSRQLRQLSRDRDVQVLEGTLTESPDPTVFSLQSGTGPSVTIDIQPDQLLVPLPSTLRSSPDDSMIVIGTMGENYFQPRLIIPRDQLSDRLYQRLRHRIEGRFPPRRPNTPHRPHRKPKKTLPASPQPLN